jgi:tRNA(Ile2) C34 agmatinyltransferase TiaS
MLKFGFRVFFIFQAVHTSADLFFSQNTATDMRLFPAGHDFVHRYCNSTRRGRVSQKSGRQPGKLRIVTCPDKEMRRVRL